MLVFFDRSSTLSLPVIDLTRHRADFFFQPVGISTTELIARWIHIQAALFLLLNTLKSGLELDRIHIIVFNTPILTGLVDRFVVPRWGIS